LAAICGTFDSGRDHRVRISVALWAPYRPTGGQLLSTALAHRRDAVPIGGGTKVNAVPSGGPVEIVDLQALGLDRIKPTHCSVGRRHRDAAADRR
jgi:hypothetical protein